MKWIWSLLLGATLACTTYAQENMEFPFNRATRITFIRLGNLEMDAGQQFVLRSYHREWSIERRISRTQEIVEKITPERAFEILAAFSQLYTHWKERPYFDREIPGYSLFISIDDSWRMALSVKDRGSPQLTQLLETIQYPEGLTLELNEEPDAKANTTPGSGIRASTEDSNESGAK